MIGGIVEGTVIPDRSGPGTNGNEGLFHTNQIFRTGAISKNEVKCLTENTLPTGLDNQSRRVKYKTMEQINLNTSVTWAIIFLFFFFY